MPRQSVLIGDDHALLRGGVQAMLERDYHVAGAASNGRELVDMAKRLKPELVVLDVSMPELNGFEAAKQIRAALPCTKLIFLSMHAQPQYLRKALQSGASAYVLKEGVAEELLDALNKVQQGQRYISPGFGPDATADLWNSTGELSREEAGLTDRQRQILQLMAEGRPNTEIAHLTGISIKTVEFHRARLMAKLGTNTAAETVRIAVEQGLIPPSV